MNICKINKPLSINSDIFQDHRGFFSKLWQGKASWIKQINISQTKKKDLLEEFMARFLNLK